LLERTKTFYIYLRAEKHDFGAGILYKVYFISDSKERRQLIVNSCFLPTNNSDEQNSPTSHKMKRSEQQTKANSTPQTL